MSVSRRHAGMEELVQILLMDMSVPAYQDSMELSVKIVSTNTYCP